MGQDVDFDRRYGLGGEAKGRWYAEVMRKEGLTPKGLDRLPFFRGMTGIER